VESFLRGPRDVLQLRSASNPRRREGKQSIPRERVCHRGALFGCGRIGFFDPGAKRRFPRSRPDRKISEKFRTGVLHRKYFDFSTS
jgi:hypothetical protein